MPSSPASASHTCCQLWRTPLLCAGQCSRWALLTSVQWAVRGWCNGADGDLRAGGALCCTPGLQLATTAAAPYLSSFAYTGCGTADANSRPDPAGTPCPSGVLDVAANTWTADDFIVAGPDGKERPWQTLMFAAQGNLTYFAQEHAKIAGRTGVRLPAVWQWDAWRALPGPAGARLSRAVLDASVANFSDVYAALFQRFPTLPPTPWGVFLGDEPHYPLVATRLADAAAAVKRRWPAAITHVNLDYETMTNSSVPPILGAAAGLDWVGSDLYYSCCHKIPSLPTF